ncbi:hypothetical protein GcM3_064035, partial [Golovinomyces cichoracearum]
RIIPTEAHSTQESLQQVSLQAPSPFQRNKNEQRYSNNSSGYRVPPQRDSWRNRSENYSKHAPFSNQRSSVDSTYPSTNGIIPFKIACWNCENGLTGMGPFHYSSECPMHMLMQWEQDILQSKSRENMSKPTASKVIINRVSSSWQAYGENTTHQTGEPSGIHEYFERDKKFGRSYSPQLQSQPSKKAKTVQFEELLSRSDSSDQSKASRVNASGNVVDFYTAEYLLDEPTSVYAARGIEKEDNCFKEDDPVASEVLLTAHVNGILARKRRRIEDLLNDEDIEPREHQRKNVAESHSSINSSMKNLNVNEEKKKRQPKGRGIIRGRTRQGDVDVRVLK